MVEQLEYRKIQVTGGNTYVISLPKKWVKDARLKPNQQIAIIPQPDQTLLIIPYGKRKAQEEIEGTIDFSANLTDDELISEFMGLYIVGYNIIKVNIEVGKSRQALKNFMHNKLIGVEIINETSNQIISRCLVADTSVPLIQTIRRMHVLAMLMLEELMDAIKKNDHKKAQEIIQEDNEVDRLYLHTLRQIKLVLNNRLLLEEVGLHGLNDTLAYRETAKCIERSADHVVKIATLLTKIEKPLEGQFLNQIINAITISIDVQEKCMKSFYKYDKDILHKSLEKIKQLTQIEEYLLEILFNLKYNIRIITALAFIIESIKRITEYGSDIAYIAKRKSKTFM